MKDTNSTLIRLNDLDLKFSKDVKKMSGTDFHTCSIQCPMAIDIAAVMDALRERALAEQVDIQEPDILNFHREVLHSIERYGRTHKIEIMMRYKLKTRDLISDWAVGMKMLAKRKLDLTPSRVERIGDVKKIFRE